MKHPPQQRIGRRLFQLVSRTIQHIAIAIACAMCMVLLCMGCANFSPWLELSVHFALHALVCTVLVIPVLWYTRHRRTAVVCCFVAACFALLVQPWSFIPRTHPQEADTLRVLAWNLLATNEEFDSIVDVIRDSNPDVLVLIEVRPDLLERAPWIKEQYPVSKVIPNWGGSGLAVFCRAETVKFSVHNFAALSMPSIVATLSSGDGARQVDLVATHTFSPYPPHRALGRDEQLRAFLEWSAGRTQPQCLVGDLNTTPWTRSFGELERAGFRDSRRGAGNCASWPAWLGVTGIPIDHALARGACAIADRRVLSTYSASDHRPIEFTLSF
jgi:endonuclease/exonuclease/phosphatase (EEP) superfamily protein YafD